MTIKLLSSEEVKQSISMPQAIEAMETAFLQLFNQQVKLPLRTPVAIEEEQALTLTMPAYLVKDKALGLKVVSIFPNNASLDKPSINGLIILLDAQTGEAKALMEAAYLTALRTGAVSGLATKYFSAPEAKKLAIIGSGAQAKTQLEAVAAVRAIEEVSVWSRNLKNAERFADSLKDNYTVNCYDTVTKTVKDADIICTATNSTEPLIELTDIQTHAHINAIGSHNSSMREISSDVLLNGIIIADQLDAVLAESGEIIHAISQDQLDKECIIELGEWLSHKNVDYTNVLTVFKSVGLAIQDISVAEIVYQNALNNKLGIDFTL